MIEEHLANCPQCLEELQKLKINLGNPAISEEKIKAMENISAKWKRDKEISFTKGSIFVSALAAMVCFIVYNVTGAKVMPVGTLVEPFALMPIGYMFSLMFLISLICYFVFLKKYRNNTK